MDNETIVNSIKNLCKENNITIGQLEKEVGLSQGLVSKWKDKTPSLDKIIDIADYFHISLDEVVGRNVNLDNDYDQENDIIIPLMRMTNNNEIQWELIKDYKTQYINDKSYEETFLLYSSDEVEIYKTKYHKSFIFLVVQYDLELGVVENLEIQLYLQPDSESIPVYQETDDKWIQEFWIGLRMKFIGVPDEWKANNVRNQIIHNNQKAILNDMEAYFNSNTKTNKTNLDYLISDENTKKILTTAYSPEIHQLIEIFSNPKMAQAMESAQKLINYFSSIKNTNENNSTIQEKVIKLSRIQGNILYDIKNDTIITQEENKIGITSESKSFYKGYKEILGEVKSIQGIKSHQVYLISDSKIMKLTGFSFGQHCGMAGYNGMLDVLKDAGFDISDQSIFDKEEFIIYK